jgi:hypothetical protein
MGAKEHEATPEDLAEELTEPTSDPYQGEWDGVQDPGAVDE